MSVITEAWARVQRLKSVAVDPDMRSERRSVSEAYDDGETWMRVTLDEAGIGSEQDIDALADLIKENAIASARNLLSMDRDSLLAIARAAGIDGPEAQPYVMMRLMHSAGFSNGLALGLELRRG